MVLILLRVRGWGWVSSFLLHMFDWEGGMCTFVYVCVCVGGVHGSEIG